MSREDGTRLHRTYDEIIGKLINMKYRFARRLALRWAYGEIIRNSGAFHKEILSFSRFLVFPFSFSQRGKIIKKEDRCFFRNFYYRPD